MVDVLQNHMHLATTVGGSPEYSPIWKWHTIERVEEPTIRANLDYALDGTTHWFALQSSGGPLVITTMNYKVIVRDEYGYTREERLQQLKSMLGRADIMLVDHLHPADGQNHASYRKTCIFTEMGAPMAINQGIQFYYVEIKILIATSAVISGGGAIGGGSSGITVISGSLPIIVTDGSGDPIISHEAKGIGTGTATKVTYDDYGHITGVSSLILSDIPAGLVRGVTGTSPISVTAGDNPVVSLGTVDTTKGGTNITNYVLGDMLYASATNVLSKLSIGSANRVLQVIAGIPAWGLLQLSNAVTGILGLINGGTGADLSATGGANQFLKQTSVGGAVTVSAINSTDLQSALLAPPAIGSTTPNTVKATDLTVTGKTDLGFSYVAPSASNYLGNIWLPRVGNLGSYIYDYLDEFAWAHKRSGAVITVTPAQSTGIVDSLFINDSNSITWSAATSPSPIVIEVDISSSAILASNNGYYNVGLTSRSSQKPTNIKIEFWDSVGGAYTTVYDQAQTDSNFVVPTNDWAWLSPRLLAPTPFNIYKLKITFTLTNPLSSIFYLQRLILYHPTSNWDNFTLSRSGGTVWGAVGFNANIVANQLAKFIARSASDKPVVIQAYSGQTANLFEVYDSTPTSLVSISSSGNYIGKQIGAGATPSATQQLISTASSATVVPVVAKGAASQSADLLQIQNSSATVLAKFISTGALFVPAISIGTNPGTFGPLNMPNNSYIVWRNAANSGDILAMKVNASNVIEFGTGFSLGNQSITGVYAISQYTSSNWTLDNVGGAYFLDTLGIGQNSKPTTEQLKVVSSSATKTTALFKAATSQSANVIEVQDSSANVNASINANGVLTYKGERTAYVSKSTNYSLAYTDHTVKFTANATATLPSASGISGQIYIIKSASGVTTTVACTGGQTIDGSATITVTPLSALWVQSDGANWMII